MNAAQNKRGVEARKNSVTFRETLSFIGFVLAVDVFILTIWTVVDPLVWERTVLAADQFGAPLESEGFCRSDHWVAFAAVIATLHLTLLGVACYMCYVARDIPTKFSEGKYLAIAMISNLQIFVVGGMFCRGGVLWSRNQRKCLSYIHFSHHLQFPFSSSWGRIHKRASSCAVSSSGMFLSTMFSIYLSCFTDIVANNRSASLLHQDE